MLLEDRWSSRPRLAEGGQGEDISDGTAAGGQMEFQAQAGGGGGQGEDRIDGAAAGGLQGLGLGSFSSLLTV